MFSLIKLNAWQKRHTCSRMGRSRESTKKSQESSSTSLMLPLHVMSIYTNTLGYLCCSALTLQVVPRWLFHIFFAFLLMEQHSFSWGFFVNHNCCAVWMGLCEDLKQHINSICYHKFVITLYNKLKKRLEYWFVWEVYFFRVFFLLF